MPWIRKALKQRSVRASAQCAVSVSAAAPDCNIASAETSLAASAAVAELSAGLDFVFDHFGDEGEPWYSLSNAGSNLGTGDQGDQFQYHLEQLCEEAEKYPGCSLSDGIGEQWSCSPGTSELLKATCQCAIMVYDQTQQIGAKGFDIEPVLHRTPSSMGAVKASSMWKIPFNPIPGWSGETLVVSIKGTATVVDHMINMNGKSQDASSLFQILVAGQDVDVQAHAGFLGCAQDLIPTITQDITQQLGADDKISNIIFTGHSAGGAVASLVFLHFLFHKNPNPKLAKTILSLITFGSPPTTDISVTDLCKDRPNIGLTLAVVNEYDMISRADGPYLRSIVDLYRSRNGLPPISDTPLPFETADPKTWPLPSPRFHLMGDILVLQLRLVEVPSVHDDDSFSRASALVTPTLQAIKLTPQEFAKLLFCDIGTHRRRAYVERMDMLTAQSCGNRVSLGAAFWAGGIADVKTVFNS